MLVVAMSAYLIPEIFSYAENVDSDVLLLATAPVAPVFNPLKWKQGQNNMGGYKPHLLYIPEFSVTGMPTISYDDSKKCYIATGAFTFASGSGSLTKPIYLYSTDGKVGFKSEPQGETDGVSFKSTLAYFFPGNLPEMHLFNAMVKNTRGYYIIEDYDGQQFLIGEEGLPATTSPSFDGGTKRADTRGTSYSATADSNYTAVPLATPIDMLVIGGYKPEPTPAP